MAGAYSVCVYKTDTKNDKKSECRLELDLAGVLVDSPLNDKVSLASCGCCDQDNDKDFCGNNEPTCVDDNADYVCGEKDGLVKTKYCYFDTKKSQNKEKCDSPWKDLKGDFVQCGECP